MSNFVGKVFHASETETGKRVLHAGLALGLVFLVGAWGVLPLSVLVSIIAAVGAFELAELCMDDELHERFVTASIATFIIVLCCSMTHWAILIGVGMSAFVIFAEWKGAPSGLRGAYLYIMPAILYPSACFGFALWWAFGSSLTTAELSSAKVLQQPGTIQVIICVALAFIGDTCAYFVGK